MATFKRNPKSFQNMGKLIFNYITRQLTPAQEKRLTTWRKLSPVNEKTFQEAIDPERIRKELKFLYESSEWRKLHQKYPELPKLSNN
jgi:hypothetical protein